MECLIWSTRMNAWLTPSGTGTSDPKDAKRFDEADAVAYCRKTRDHTGQVQSFPVPVYLVLAVSA